MEHAPRAGRGGGAAVVLTLLIALVEAVEAAAWHRAQEFRAQARAAAEAAVLLRDAAALAGGRPGAGPEPRTGRVTRAAGRGLPAAAPGTGTGTGPPAPGSAPAGSARLVAP
ncbi:hypothetical protein [Streptomyces yangpuensis]|uniref:hypothetical protein n=1 Tax=Streptomyces yangpuensis TaxID=1648182 RepID=UPI000629D0F6|nr:hypothetical protein [Streptomyces yangpuensis]